MRLRIRSDGTPAGTHIEDLELGVRLDDVLAVTWRVTAEDTATAIIVLERVAVDLEGEAP